MRRQRDMQSTVFLFILLIPGTIFCWKIWHLLPLYTSSSVRESVRSAMTDVAAREGWILSDMLVTDVTADRIRLTHREHLRGNDLQTCQIITLADHSLHPCDAKLN